MKTFDFVATLFDGKSNPNKMTVVLTMGVNALQKGHSAVLILMLEAVELGQPDAMDGIDIGAPFESASVLLKKFKELGGHIAVCGPCMIHNGFTASQMVPDYEVIKAPQVIDWLMNAKGSLQIT